MLTTKKNTILACLSFALLSCSERLEYTEVPKNNRVDSIIFAGILLLAGIILLYLITRLIINAINRISSPRRNEKNESNDSDRGREQVDEISRLKRVNEDLMKKLNECKIKCEDLEKEKKDAKEELVENKPHLEPVEENFAQTITLSVEPIISEKSMKIKYSKFADENAVFPHTHLTSSDDGYCYYKLEIDEERRTGNFEPIISELNIYSFKNNKSMLLFPYCEVVNISDTWNGIKILDHGTLKYQDAQWIVKNKCKIELV